MTTADKFIKSGSITEKLLTLVQNGIDTINKILNICDRNYSCLTNG
jgi:hypothetical protein